MQSYLYFKHRIATSNLPPFVGRARGFFRTIVAKDAPELSLLRAEEHIMGKVLPKLIQPGMTCLDIGAHIGSVAHQMERIAGAGNVQLVEAIPEKAQWLRKRFGDDNVTEVALSSEAGHTTFHQDLKQPGFSSVYPSSQPENVKVITVKTDTLDNLFGDMPIEFIKIDVEGHELQVLKSGAALLKKQKPTIVFEAGPYLLEINKHADELYSYLTEELGYEIFACFELSHRISGISKEQFQHYRTYPFLAFNFVAISPQNYAKLRAPT